VLEGNTVLPYDKEVKTKGNEMTQNYYTKRLLPVYTDALRKLRIQEPDNSHSWLFQEDGDLSRGIKKAVLVIR
jgi:hypothetical protein